MIRLFLLAFGVSLLACYLTLRFEHLHRRFTGDVAAAGSHKVHRRPVSRIGGLSVFLGWLAGVIAAAQTDRLDPLTAGAWLFCLSPAFIGGFVEDLTKHVRPLVRLGACFISAGLAYTLLGASVSRIDVIGIDSLLLIPAVAFAFTCIAVGGVAHATNIIDGLNGLASGVCLVALLALGYVAFQVTDWDIVLLSGIGVGAVLGFRIWNYPSGRIFCGDGGAYFLGAYVAILSALLVNRHASVSAWFPLLLVLYPVWETLFSAYRRRVLRGRPASVADKLHMHTLFYKRIKQPEEGGKARSRRNSDASVSMSLFACGGAVPAVLWWDDGRYLLAAAFAYVIVYLVIYRRLVRFKAGSRPFGAATAGYVMRYLATLPRGGSAKRIRESNKLR